MKDTTREEILRGLASQREYFATDETKNVDFRILQLKRFRDAILRYEDRITDALFKDLHKSKEEAYLTEISIVLSEINNHIKNLRRWSKPKSVKSTLAMFPSKSKVMYEPLGMALIIAPWNYPFQLLMNPLVGAISAGCCTMLKASPYTPHTAVVMEELIKETFPEKYVFFSQGHREVNTILLEQKFDFVFFTGSPSLGKIVMKSAAENLTPVILELGGKSPCIVNKDANISITAKRIMWGKTINAGQTCIAPDYLFVHEDVKANLVKEMESVLKDMYGANIKQSPFYAGIVDDKAMRRLASLMQEGEILLGGEVDEKEKFIAPTVIDDITSESLIMQEEIFGPLLPMMSFTELDEVIDYINSKPKPLALYYFGENKKTAKEVIKRTSSGGVCINDTLMHIVNHHLPFGGVGNSGLGKYHGYDSFLAFSNRKAIVSTPTIADVFLRYAPYKYFKLTKKLMN